MSCAGVFTPWIACKQSGWEDVTEVAEEIGKGLSGERKGSSMVTDCTSPGQSEALETAALRRLPMFPMLAERGRVEIGREPSTTRGALVVAEFVRLAALSFSEEAVPSLNEISYAFEASAFGYTYYIRM